MRKFERIDLGGRFALDRDSLQWILLRAGESKDGGVSRTKSGEVHYKPVGYFPTLRAALDRMVDMRLGETHVDDWRELVRTIDARLMELESCLPGASGPTRGDWERLSALVHEHWGVVL